jgi:uncharacterized membrane protein YozB (DUF420 family)
METCFSIVFGLLRACKSKLNSLGWCIVQPKLGFSIRFVNFEVLKLSNMHTGLLHLHSLLRWVLLILLLVMIYRAFTGKRSGRSFDSTDRKFSLFTMISAHLQLVIGLVLYVMNDTVMTGLSNMASVMKDSGLRFLVVEHISTMIIGIVLITIGHIKAKRATTDASKFQSIFVFFLIGLVLILSRIPWPFMEVGQGKGWF